MITHAHLPMGPHPVAARFGYLGWIGHANLGDDAIAQVLQAALPASSFHPVPAYPGEFMAAARDHRLGELTDARLLLGGGTVIGRTNWRVHVSLGMRLCRGGPALMIGAGVEDPSFRGRRSFSAFGELRRWRSLLRRFERVTVRGPHSARLLADIGVTAEVVGDPALMIGQVPGVVREAGRVGVALGYGDSLRGGDQGAVTVAVAMALARLSGLGHPITVFSVNPTDRTHADECLRHAGLSLGRDDVEVINAADPLTFCTHVGRCEVVVAERLHAGILGAACGTLPVMLAYQPKVDDFMASIGAEHWSTPTDRVSSGLLVDQVTSLCADADSQRLRLSTEVDRLRVSLAAAIRTIGATPRADAAGLAS